MTKITSITQPLGEDAADHKDDPHYLEKLETDEASKLKQSITKVFKDLEFTEADAEAAPLGRTMNKWLETSRCCMLAAASGAGKTCLINALSRELAEEGFRIAYMHADEKARGIARDFQDSLEHPNITYYKVSMERGAADRVMAMFWQVDELAKNYDSPEELRGAMNWPDMIVLDTADQFFDPDSANRQEIMDTIDLFCRVAVHTDSLVLLLHHFNKDNKDLSVAKEKHGGKRNVKNQVDGLFYLTHEYVEDRIVTELEVKKYRGELNEGEKLYRYDLNLHTLELKTELIPDEQRNAREYAKVQSQRPTVEAIQKALELGPLSIDEALKFVSKAKTSNPAVMGQVAARRLLKSADYLGKPGYWAIEPTGIRNGQRVKPLPELSPTT